MSSAAMLALKAKGNKHYEVGDYQQACEYYGQALEIDPGNAVLLSNRAASFIKMGRYVDALQDATKAVEAKGNWHKAHFRKSVAHLYCEDLSSALRELVACVDLDPQNMLQHESLFYETLVNAVNQSDVAILQTFGVALSDGECELDDLLDLLDAVRGVRISNPKTLNPNPILNPNLAQNPNGNNANTSQDFGLAPKKVLMLLFAVRQAASTALNLGECDLALLFCGEGSRILESSTDLHAELAAKWVRSEFAQCAALAHSNLGNDLECVRKAEESLSFYDDPCVEHLPPPAVLFRSMLCQRLLFLSDLTFASIGCSVDPLTRIIELTRDLPSNDEAWARMASVYLKRAVVRLNSCFTHGGDSMDAAAEDFLSFCDHAPNFKLAVDWRMDTFSIQFILVAENLLFAHYVQQVHSGNYQPSCEFFGQIESRMLRFLSPDDIVFMRIQLLTFLFFHYALEKSNAEISASASAPPAGASEIQMRREIVRKYLPPTYARQRDMGPLFFAQISDLASRWIEKIRAGSPGCPDHPTFISAMERTRDICNGIVKMPQILSSLPELYTALMGTASNGWLCTCIDVENPHPSCFVHGADSSFECVELEHRRIFSREDSNSSNKNMYPREDGKSSAQKIPVIADTTKSSAPADPPPAAATKSSKSKHKRKAKKKDKTESVARTANNNSPPPPPPPLSTAPNGADSGDQPPPPTEQPTPDSAINNVKVDNAPCGLETFVSLRSTTSGSPTPPPPAPAPPLPHLDDLMRTNNPAAHPSDPLPGKLLPANHLPFFGENLLPNGNLQSPLLGLNFPACGGSVIQSDDDLLLADISRARSTPSPPRSWPISANFLPPPISIQDGPIGQITGAPNWLPLTPSPRSPPRSTVLPLREIDTTADETQPIEDQDENPILSGTQPGETLVDILLGGVRSGVASPSPPSTPPTGCVLSADDLDALRAEEIALENALRMDAITPGESYSSEQLLQELMEIYARKRSPDEGESAPAPIIIDDSQKSIGLDPLLALLRQHMAQGGGEPSLPPSPPPPPPILTPSDFEDDQVDSAPPPPQTKTTPTGSPRKTPQSSADHQTSGVPNLGKSPRGGVGSGVGADQQPHNREKLPQDALGITEKFYQDIIAQKDRQIETLEKERKALLATAAASAGAREDVSGSGGAEVGSGGGGGGDSAILIETELLKKEISELKERHERELRRVRAECEAEIDRTKLEAEARVRRLEVEHSATLSRTLLEHEVEMARVTAQSQIDAQNGVAGLLAELNSIKLEREREAESQRKKFNDQISEFEAKLKRADSEREEAHRALRILERKMIGDESELRSLSTEKLREFKTNLERTVGVIKLIKKEKKAEAERRRKEEEKARLEERLCVMCKVADKEVLVLPCAHLCLCKGCAASQPATASCPVCKQRIESKIRVVR